MPVPDEATLAAVLRRRPAAAAAVTAAWDAGEAILPSTPRSRPRDRRPCSSGSGPPTSLDGDGRQALAGGVPVAGRRRRGRRHVGHRPARRRASSSRGRHGGDGARLHRALGVGAGDRWLACLPLHHVASLGVLARARTSPACRAPCTTPSTSTRSRASPAERRRDDRVARADDAAAPARRRRAVARVPRACIARRRARAGRRAHARATAAGATVVDAYGLSETWGGFALDGVADRRRRGRARARRRDPRARRDGDARLPARPGDTAPRSRRSSTPTAGSTPATSARSTTTAGCASSTGVEGPRHHRRREREPDRGRDACSRSTPTSPTCAWSASPDDEWGERVVAFVVPRDAGRGAVTRDAARVRR